MMDDLLSLDFNILDDDLLSFPMDEFKEFNPIESREIESILNEIEQSANEQALMSPFNQIRPTIMFNNGRTAIKASKKSKSSKIGTSLLAKPPKKLKKDKNSLLSRNGATTTSLLFNAGNRKTNSVIISQAAFTAYFYQDHNYCFNPQPANDGPSVKTETASSSAVDLNNNQNDEFRLANTSCLTIETKEIVIDDNQVLKKKANLTSGNTLNLISPNNMFATSDCETVHDLDDYFNISFSEEGSSSTDSTNQSETEDENKFDLESELGKLDRPELCEEKAQIVCDEAKPAAVEESNDAATSKVEQPIEAAKASNDEQSQPVKPESPVQEGDGQVATAEHADQTTAIKSVLIDDLANYNITDTDNELISLDDDDEDDDILIETDETEEFILIDEMFGDFPEYDLISSSKKGKNSSKNSANKRAGNSRSNSMSSHRSNSFSKSPKVQVVVAANANRRTRTISNSYSVRSSSSCSCCSEDMSEEEHQSPGKRNESVTAKLSHQQSKSKPANRRSASKLIKGDASFIKKSKNNGRFLMHKTNVSF